MQGWVGGEQGWKKQICFLVLSASCFEVFRIPKASDIPSFECKNKWFTATSDGKGGIVSFILPPSGRTMENGLCSGFPSPASAGTWQPEGLPIKPPASTLAEKPSYQEVCKGSVPVMDHLFIHPCPLLCLLVSLT